MDKEEFRVKLEEINKLVMRKDYKDAMKVVDSIDWRRVKNVRTLCVVGEIYAANQRYDDSKEIFLLAYHRAPIGKNILYRLVEISLKMGDIDEARDFYEEYKEVAPDDSALYILKYKILSESQAPIQKQIKALEKYKKIELTEKWSYELAKLYYQAGEMDKCLDVCNEIIVWFNEGSYVMQAMDLKLRMGKLTGEEKERYEQNFVPKLLTPDEVQKIKDGQENEVPEEDDSDREEPEIGMISINNERELGSVESIQEKISKGIRDIFGGNKKESGESGEGDYVGDEIPKELIKTPSDRQTIVDAPNLEEEGSRGIIKNEIEMAASESSASLEDTSSSEEASSDGIKVSKLDIPDSMKNFEEKSSPEFPKARLDDVLSGDNGEEENRDFNMEDTILAAASAQGIQIPEGQEPDEDEQQEKPEEADTAEAAEQDAELEEEEFLSEEDLKAAEDEFLYGPNASQKESSGESENADVPQLEDEDFIREGEIVDAEEDEAEYQEDFEPDDENYEEEPLEEDSFEEEKEEKTKEALSEEEELEQFIESIQPKEERDLLDIIPREKELTEEEKGLFTYFVKVSGLKEQIVETLLDAQLAAADKTSKSGNIIVMGGRETGKTRLIAGLIPAICKERNIEASKVAYVFAEQINGLDMSKVVDKLSGGFLVIENANQLTKETVKQLGKAMEFRTDGLTVILEDEKINMRKMIARFPKFSKKFTSIINIPVFTNDELVNFARIYTKENGYRIDQMGLLALYNLIGINQKEDRPMNVGSVKDILDAAIAKSQGGILKLGKKKRVDRDGYIVLYEKDFAK